MAYGKKFNKKKSSKGGKKGNNRRSKSKKIGSIRMSRGGRKIT